jgi:DNA-directed RNA polymerase specialized sigma subunit
MEIIAFFEKLDKDILILTQEVKLFQIKLDFIIDASAPQMPKDIIFGEAKGNNFFTAEELYNEVINLKTTINLLLKALEELKVMKDIIEKNLKDFIKTSNDLEYLIIKNHYIEKKSLKKIAQDLGYSYQYIRKTHMEIKKKLGK